MNYYPWKLQVSLEKSIELYYYSIRNNIILIPYNIREYSINTE
jgi:hypothetical protein